MRKFKLTFLGMLLLLVSLACVITLPAPGGSLPATLPVDTPTPFDSPTPTLEPSITPFPTPTRRAVTTEAVFAFPTITPLPLIPTMTLADFSEQVIGGSPTATSTPGKRAIWSPTPAALKCEVEVLNPAFGEDIKPRNDFMAIWRLYNVGTAPWAKEEFYFEYVEGAKMHKQDYVPKILSFTVYAKDRVKFETRLTAPKEPGRYTTTWGMRRSNKKEPFCTFSITIDVVK
jgi:hypothetical protein